MSSDFNPYSSWLGIPEDEQPPHYYRLLGLEPFENDPDVIRQAGQKVLGIVKARDKGSFGPAARRLKAEVTFAASCLLDPRKKAQYDKELDAWFNEYDDGGGDDDEYELEEPDLPLAKIVQRVPEKKSSAGTKSSGSKVKSGSKSKSGSSKSKAKAKAEQEQPVAAGKKANVQLIALIAAMVLAIVGLGGGLAFVFLRSDEPVAKASDKVAKKEAAADNKAADSEEEEEDEEESSAAAQTGTTDEEEGTATKAATDAQPAPGAADQPPTDEKMPEGAAAADPATPAATDGAKPETQVAAADPKTTPEQPTGTEPKPEDAKKDEAAKDVPKKDEPKQEPAKEEEPKDPFREVVGDALELPVFVDAATSTSPVTLVKLYPNGEERVNVRLTGGDVVVAKVGEFSLSGGSLTDPEPKWTVKFVDKQGAATPIAEIAYKANELTFAWTGKGDAETINVLRNCLLKVSVGYASKNLPLRRPIEIDPLAVVMEPKGTFTEIDVVGMPEDRSTVRFLFTHLTGGFPEKPDYDPGPEIGPGDKVDITFAKMDLAFKAMLTEEKGNVLKLDFRPMLRSPKKSRNGTRALIAYPANVNLDAQVAQINMVQAAQAKRYEALKGQIKDKDALAKLELDYQQFVRDSGEQIKNTEEAKKMLEQLKTEGKVHFRIFMRVADSTVDLLKTKAPPAPEPEKKAEEKKPAGKKKK